MTRLFFIRKTNRITSCTKPTKELETNGGISFLELQIYRK